MAGIGGATGTGGAIGTGGAAGAGTGGVAGVGGATATGGATSTGGGVGTGGTPGTGGGGGALPWAQLQVCGAIGWGAVNGLALSSDAASVAIAGPTVKLFDVATTAVTRTFVGLTNDATSVAISPDGTLIAGSSFLAPYAPRNVHVVVWKAADASVVWTQSSVAGVYSVAFSPDGQLLAIAGYDSTVTLMSTVTWRTVGVYTGHQSPVGHVVFSPDGSLIASSDTSATVKIWRVADLMTKETLQGSSPVSGFSAAFSPDGTQLLSSVLGERIRVSDGSVLQTGLGIGADAFSPDGLTFIAGGLYRMSDGAALRTPPKYAIAAAYLPDSSHALIVPEGSENAITWSITDGTTSATFTARKLESAITVVSDDGTRAFIGNQMFGLPSGNLLYQSSFATTGSFSAAFSPDGSLVATTTESGGLYLMNAADGSLNGSVPAAHAGVIRTVAFSPTGDRIATCSDDHLIKIWSTTGLTPLKTLGGIQGPTTSVQYVAWSPDGSSVAGVGGGTFIWKVATGAISQTLNNIYGFPLFSTDGSTLMMLGPDVIQSFDVTTGQPVGIVDVPDESQAGGPILGRPFTANEGIIVGSAAGDGVDLWGLPQGQHLTTLSDPPVAKYAYFAPNSLVVAGGGKVVVWCPGSGAGGGTGGGGTEPMATACSGAGSYVADFDGDGIADCATSPAQSQLSFYKGVDASTVETPAVISPVGCLPTSSTTHLIADMNGDGRADLVFVTGVPGSPTYPYEAFMIAGRSDGTFRCSSEPSARVGSLLSSVAPVLGDYEGGPGASVLLAGFEPSTFGSNNQIQLVVLSGTRTTTALSVQLLTVGYAGALGTITSLAGPDLNGDGHTDVVLNVNNRPLQGPITPVTYTYYGDGNGTFSGTPP